MKDKVQQYCFVIKQLNRKEKSHNNSEMKMGKLWSVVDPLIFMIVMSSIYGTMFKRDMNNFAAFYFIGYIIFVFYKNGTTSAMHSLVNSKNFLIKTKIPMNVFVVERVYTALINMFYSSAAFIFVMIYYKMHVNWKYFAIIPDLFFTFIIILGISKFLAIAFVFFQDIDYLYSLFMTIVMFASALLYPKDRFGNEISKIIDWNPVYISITIIRNAVIDNCMSDVTLWIKLILWAIVTYIIGTIFFEKYRNNIMQKL